MLWLVAIPALLAPLASGCDLCSMGMPQDHSGQQQQQQQQQQQMMMMYQQQQMMQAMMNNMQQQMSWGGWGNKPQKPSQPTRPSGPTVTTTGCQGFADVIFLLDSSGSIGTESFTKQLRFVADVAESFSLRTSNYKAGYQFGVASFSDTVREEITLGQYQTKQQLAQAITGIPFMGKNTDTHKALGYARDQAFLSSKGGRYGAVKIVIVITDGRSNQPAETENMAEAVRKQGVLVLAIGVGSDVDPDELKKIASTDRNVFQVESYAVLNTIKQAVEQRACTITIEAGGAVNTSAAFDWQTYLKWCAEQQVMTEKRESTQKLLEAFEKMEQETKMKQEVRHKQESEKANVAFMEKRWKEAMIEVEHFDKLTVMKMEMQHKYMFEISSQMIRFCPLGKYTDEVTRFMMHGDSQWTPGNEDHCNVEDMQNMNKNQDPAVVAQQVANLPKEKQLELFFGGLKDSVCAGLIEYLDKIQAWTVQYPAFASTVSMF